jgi:hypothetical protein
MLKTCNLTSTVYFPTRTTNISAMLIDNIFINYTRNYNVNLCVNGLSDHDAQLITINNIIITKVSKRSVNIRVINKESITKFQFVLSWEQWEDIFENEDVNTMFNNFLNTYLRCFYASFPIIIKKSKFNQNKWITVGIRTSCKRKRQLVLLCRYNNDVNMRTYYLRQYSKILTKVITAAEKLYYDRIIKNLDNKMESTWKIINEERGKTKKDIDIQALVLDKKITMNQKEMAEILNNYFLSIATISRVNNNIDIGTNVDPSVKYLWDIFSTPFTKMKWRYTTTQEIEKTIKSFKTKILVDMMKLLVE